MHELALKIPGQVDIFSLDDKGRDLNRIIPEHSLRYAVDKEAIQSGDDLKRQRGPDRAETVLDQKQGGKVGHLRVPVT